MSKKVTKRKSSKEIVRQTNALAAKFASVQGIITRPNQTFHTAQGERYLSLWQMACIAQTDLLGVDPDMAVTDLAAARKNKLNG